MADNTFYQVEYKANNMWVRYSWNEDGHDTQDDAEAEVEEATDIYRFVRVRKVVESDVAVYTDGVKDA